MAKEKKPLSAGDRVKFTRRNGEDIKGKLTGVTLHEKNGDWHQVDTPAGVIKVRLSQLTRA